MNFFERQDQARRKSSLLVILYILAVVSTVLAIHSLVVCFFCESAAESAVGEFSSAGALPAYWRAWLDPSLLLTDTLIVTLIIGSASILKILSLKSSGGDGVATALGGTLVKASTQNFQERRLLHIVEEMAIASGIRIPNVYVLKKESGINAFAAGFSPETSVVAVTQGALDYLSRDELQGVVGHEFSHILHQDTNLNLKLIGILFGLEMLVLIGLTIFRGCTRISLVIDTGNSKDKGAGTAVILAVLLISIGVMIIGLIGQLFSNMIRSAISRQREFLADASAVQYTRNPDGIAGALKKIGCPNIGSQVENTRSSEAAHMFFGNVFTPGFFSRLFDSHPDLSVRITRIDPSFDGRFPETVQKIARTESETPPTVSPTLSAAQTGQTAAQTGQTAAQTGQAAAQTGQAAALAAAMVASVGEANHQKLRIAESLLESIPAEASEAVRTPLGAQAAIFAILLSADPELRVHEWAIFDAAAPDNLRTQVHTMVDWLAGCSESVKIPLAELAFPVLKNLPQKEYLAFRQSVCQMIKADQKIDLLEYTLYGVVIRDLDRAFGLVQIPKPKYKNLAPILDSYYLVMSFLAYAGNDDPRQQRQAFEAGCESLHFKSEIKPRSVCTPKNFAEALGTLAEATFVLRQKLLTSFYCCIAADGQITEREGELVRAVAAHFDCPMPTWR